LPASGVEPALPSLAVRQVAANPRAAARKAARRVNALLDEFAGMKAPG